jgi:hypothetical protein
MTVGWTVWIVLLALVVAFVAVMDRRSRHRHIGTKRHAADRPVHEQRPPGDGFQANQQSGKFGPWG